MPWRIERTSQCPVTKPFGVIQETDGKLMGCHATRDDAKEQLAALYSNEPGAKDMGQERDEEKGFTPWWSDFRAIEYELKAGKYTEELHPRYPKGHPRAGQYMPKHGAEGGGGGSGGGAEPSVSRAAHAAPQGLHRAYRQSGKKRSLRPEKPSPTPERDKLSPEDQKIVDQAFAQLKAGKKTRCEPKHLPAIGEQLRTIKSKEPKDHPNLELLHVDDFDDGCLFDKHETETPRKQMPQIPPEPANLVAFTQFLNDMGYHVSTETPKPSELHATQNELDGVKSSNIAANYDPALGGVIFIDRNGAILDGHHRWAASVLFELENPDYRMDAVRIDGDINDLLTLSLWFDAQIGIQQVGFGEGKSLVGARW